MNSITAFAPATVANVGCGFDIMGFALRDIGDKVTVSIAEDSQENTFNITGIYGHLLPEKIESNTAGVALRSYLAAAGKTGLGLKIVLEKNLPLGSGLGSSASSAAAALTALNELMGGLFRTEELIPFTMEGEKLASGSAHADNAAPSLLGGFVLVRNNNPLDIIRVKCPPDLFCTVIHPHIQVKTSDARRILKREIPFFDAVRQSANTAGFITGLITCDYDLIGRSMNDFLAEPSRIKLIPGFDSARKAAIGAGAIGCGISGSGPSIFAIFRGEDNGSSISKAIRDAFSDAGLESDEYLSSLNEPGAYII